MYRVSNKKRVGIWVKVALFLEKSFQNQLSFVSCLKPKCLRSIRMNYELEENQLHNLTAARFFCTPDTVAPDAPSILLAIGYQDGAVDLC